MTCFSFDAFTAAALFPQEGAAFALGDGTVRWTDGAAVEAHDGPVLCAAVHPSGEGVVTGGDDGRLVWSRPSGAQELADTGGTWIDAVATAPETGLIALAAGREARVLDAADPAFARSFRHERAVADLAFDGKGRRLATATYGGVQLRYARVAEQKPTGLKWPGAHIGVLWSPDARFVLSALQENQLHGWRLSDAKDMRMAGYPAKVRSLAFLAKGALLASSGAHGAVIWPFAGANGPMGKDAVEIGFKEETLVTRVAGAGFRLVGGRDDGEVWTADLQSSQRAVVREAAGAPVTALAVSADGSRCAWGDESGAAGVAELPA